jgi:voltage-gated potassium channel
MVEPTATPRDNFIWLLFALILLLFSGAWLEQVGSKYGSTVINISLTVTLLVAVWSIQQEKRWYHSKWGVSTIVAGLAVGDHFLEISQLPLIHLFFILIFIVTSTILAGRQVLFSGNVDFNKIVGAVCIYILIGLAWAVAYLITEQLYPGSLSGFGAGTWQDNMQAAVYYSFVTLTTLGYGEITPLMPLSRALAYTEAIAGQFYIAILVASLIGVRLAAMQKKGD